MADEISKVFELEPLPSNLPAVIVPEDSTEDFNFARENLYQTIAIGQDALQDLASLVKQSQSARAYEVLANTLKTLADINGQLLDLESKRKENDKPVEEGPTTVNNNLVLTTEQLQKMLQGIKKNAD